MNRAPRAARARGALHPAHRPAAPSPKNASGHMMVMMDLPTPGTVSVARPHPPAPSKPAGRSLECRGRGDSGRRCLCARPRPTGSESRLMSYPTSGGRRLVVIFGKCTTHTGRSGGSPPLDWRPRCISEDAAPPIRPHCGARSAQVRHKCGASAAQVRRKCGASAAQVRHGT